jgi:hypothetical protein
VTVADRSPTEKPAWYRGPDTTWSLDQEIAWLETQRRPEVLRGYLQGLPFRVRSFDGQPLSREERTRLAEVCRRRLKDIVP